MFFRLGNEIAMEDKIELKVLGFSFNQNKTGAYGLVLSELVGRRRLVVVVGATEAQAIAFKLQATSPPRPLTHDLIYAMLTVFDIVLHEVIIYAYVDGVFYSKLILQAGDRIVELDSRTSDAINIALRTNSPIYTTAKIMLNMGVVFDEDNVSDIESVEEDNSTFTSDYSKSDNQEIKAMLEKAVNDENYELASMLRDELKRRKA